MNRPKNLSEFQDETLIFTKTLVNAIEKSNSKTSIIYTSSIQAELDNDYGRSKKEAESIF